MSAHLAAHLERQSGRRQMMDSRVNASSPTVEPAIMAPAIGQDGRIQIPGVSRAITLSEYRKLVALYGRIVEAKILIDSYLHDLRLQDGLYPDSASMDALTPLQFSNEHRNLFYKREDRTAVRAYKLRGAFVGMAKVMAERNVRRFLAVSTGNHALGVLKAAELLQPESVRIVVPHSTAPNKLEKLRQCVNELFNLGMKAELVFRGDTFDEARDWAKTQSTTEPTRSTDSYYLDPYNDPWVVAGQGTIGLELYHQVKAMLKGNPNVKELAVVSPIGGGGLLGGLSTGLRLSAAWDPQLRHVDLKFLGLRLSNLQAKYGDAIKVIEPASDNQMLFQCMGVQIQTMDDPEMQYGIDILNQDLGHRVEGASGGTLYPIFHQEEFSPSQQRMVVSIVSGANATHVAE